MPGKNNSNIPEVVVQRLPQYVRALTQLHNRNIEVVSSKELGDALSVTPAQIRKDLSYFGRFGKQGRGYNVVFLLQELRRVLGLDKQWTAAVIGIGRLGSAILSYPGFGQEGFNMVAAFDSAPLGIGSRIGELIVQSIDELEKTVKSKAIDIVIVAVPAEQAQSVTDRVVKCGVKAILNYAPIKVQVPSDVRVREIDPVLALQSMTFHLKSLRD